LALLAPLLFSQTFTRQDSLRGSITAERAWWNLTQYDLAVEVQPDERFIQGSNTISYEVLESNTVIQIDLQPPMQLDKIVQDGTELSFTSEGNAHFIQLQKKQQNGETNTLTIYFSGKPRSRRALGWWIFMGKGQQRKTFCRHIKSRNWS